MIFRLTSIFCVAVSCVALRADEPALRQLGQSVDLKAKAPASTITAAIPRPGYELILNRLKIEPTPGGTPAFFVSGRVISDNTGIGIERVAIFIGQEDQAPKLAAMTNADGDFKFRLYIKDDQRDPKVSIPPNFSGYLYVGGEPSRIQGDELRLMSGYAVRYKMRDLAELNKLELPYRVDAKN